MQNRDVLDRQMTRRLLLGAAGMGGLALLPAPARADETVDLRVPGGPSTRAITTAFPQKGRMILQRTSPPWLETPFEVFDKGIFTPNDQHYVSWHWANFPSDIDVDKFRACTGVSTGTVSPGRMFVMNDLGRFLCDRHKLESGLTWVDGVVLRVGNPVARRRPVVRGAASPLVAIVGNLNYNYCDGLSQGRN